MIKYVIIDDGAYSYIRKAKSHEFGIPFKNAKKALLEEFESQIAGYKATIQYYKEAKIKLKNQKE
jgi:hypothetical protein